jgi:dipeptidyl aminopeptidase/acylaminoacyl peptidase
VDNPDVKPPLLVKAHGGPTSSTSTTFRLDIQYWTTRRFGVLDVDYGGSTGYGKEYRQLLRKQWGIVDVEDVCSGALYCVEQGWANGDWLAIDGRSAGGYTTLAALTFSDVFKAGASLYGVSDLVTLNNDTHKFESRYLEGLIGPYPDDKAIYDERCPIKHTERLDCPVLLLQGDEDKIVPPNQAEMMFSVF